MTNNTNSVTHDSARDEVLEELLSAVWFEAFEAGEFSMEHPTLPPMCAGASLEALRAHFLALQERGAADAVTHLCAKIMEQAKRHDSDNFDAPYNWLARCVMDARDSLVATQPSAVHRFPETYCSQCGEAFGPGDHGFSHCESHQGMAPKEEE